jgi:hypothetical protein
MNSIIFLLPIYIYLNFRLLPILTTPKRAYGIYCNTCTGTPNCFQVAKNGDFFSFFIFWDGFQKVYKFQIISIVVSQRFLM